MKAGCQQLKRAKCEEIAIKRKITSFHYLIHYFAALYGKLLSSICKKQSQNPINNT
ncbi:MAG: hypothetical protein MR279_06880 [Bacteroidales bacterium]|nr:hypothetical protein [Bacteroidales bacterium]MCI6416311.1 hypothetical protein [Bacteroidales bacterium]